ncbi:kinase-like domain-containing protein [Sporodiniella umbellata]|nr:kinase-like domain-containing protein [Sporodiniella umbellata]
MSFNGSEKREHSLSDHCSMSKAGAPSTKNNLLLRSSSNIRKIANKVSPPNKTEMYTVRDTIPTRLPAPLRRPTVTEQLNEEHLTPPSSPERTKTKAQLAKIQTENGKSNQEPYHFDPLISPIESGINKKELSVPFLSVSSKTGIQVSSSSMDESKEKNKTTNNTTRLPIPIQNRQSTVSKFVSNKGKCNGLVENNETGRETQMLEEMNIGDRSKDDSTVSTTKLRKPEIFASKSLKTTHRLVPPSELFQGHSAKEKENSTQPCASLVSAQGVISQPDDVAEATTDDQSELNVMEKIHDRLQLFVDHESIMQEEAFKTNYKRGSIEAGSARMNLQRYKAFLSPYEKIEILKYHSVYCVGSQAEKHIATMDQITQNHGYDDENGDYQIVLKDHLNYRYEITKSLGKGSFGQVVQCKDMKPQSKNSEDSDQIVAIKIIRNKKRFHAQALTEIKILETIMQLDPHNKHSIVRMFEHFYFRGHLCIVFECLSSNLFEVLQKNSYQGFSMGLVKRFATQILTSLTLLGENNIIHCDLKPENILLKNPEKSGIRVIDLGSSCFVNERVYSYIQSRFYRAPEVILGMEYGLPIDMWSTGCILAELYTGRPLFPGESEPDQLACIMQLIGVPKRYYLEKCARKKQFFDLYDSPRKSINSKGKKRKPGTLTFTEASKRTSQDAFDRDFADFLSKCITWEPSERMTPEQALNHSWLKGTKK